MEFQNTKYPKNNSSIAWWEDSTKNSLKIVNSYKTLMDYVISLEESTLTVNQCDNFTFTMNQQMKLLKEHQWFIDEMTLEQL